MKITAICNITLQEKLNPISACSEDESLKSSSTPVVYPINSVLSQFPSNSDIQILLLSKTDPDNRYLSNAQAFKDEFEALCADNFNTIEYSHLEIPFEESRADYADLIRGIVDGCSPGSTIVCDITYGSKDFPIILFSALAFLTKHLNCIVEHILYRRVFFRDGVPTWPVLCDMANLLNLTSLLYTVNTSSHENARKMLDTLLTL